MTMTAPDTDVLALGAFRRLADGLRRGAVELRGVTAAPGSGLHAAAAAVDELADLILAEADRDVAAVTAVTRPVDDPYDQLPEG
jgi:hypothetical protein